MNSSGMTLNTSLFMNSGKKSAPKPRVEEEKNMNESLRTELEWTKKELYKTEKKSRQLEEDNKVLTAETRQLQNQLRTKNDLYEELRISKLDTVKELNQEIERLKMEIVKICEKTHEKKPSIIGQFFSMFSDQETEDGETDD